MKMLNDQQIFNKVIRGLAAQGFKQSAVRTGGTTSCVYRAPSGLKCAAGHLIADEHYRRGLEGRSCDYPEVIEALGKSGVPRGAVLGDDLRFYGEGLVRRLQRAHDSLPDPEEMKTALAVAGLEFGLTIPKELA